MYVPEHTSIDAPHQPRWQPYSQGPGATLTASTSTEAQPRLSKPARAKARRRDHAADVALALCLSPIVIIAAYYAKTVIGIDLMEGHSPLHALLFWYQQ